MALTVFEEAFGAKRNRIGKVQKREATTEHLVTVTAAVQSVVDTFRDPRTGDRYIVSLSDRVEAYTAPGTKRIVVSYKPIFDKGLKVSTACTVMTGLVLHEIGHTLYTFPNLPVVAKAFGTPGEYTSTTGYSWDKKKAWDQLAYTMLNIGDDALLEARMAANLPIARDIFPTMLHWVAISTGMVGSKLRWTTNKQMDMTAKVNFACRAVRYPWTATWSNDARTREERLWWAAWGAAYIALADGDGAGMVRLVTAAVERLRSTDEPDTEPGPEPEPKGNEPEPPDTTCGPEPFGNDFDKTEDEDEDEDEDDDADGDDDSDEDEDSDDDGGSNSWDDDEDESDEDEDGEGESDEGEDADDDEADGDESEDGESGDEPTDEDGEDADDDESDTDDDGSEAEDGEGKDESDGDTDEAGDSKVGDTDEDEAKDHTFPDDFNAHDLDGSVDNLNRSEDWSSKNNGVLLQKELDAESVMERVPTGTWGTARVEVRSIGELAANARKAAEYRRNRGW